MIEYFFTNVTIFQIFTPGSGSRSENYCGSRSTALLTALLQVIIQTQLTCLIPTLFAVWWRILSSGCWWRSPSWSAPNPLTPPPPPAPRRRLPPSDCCHLQAHYYSLQLLSGFLQWGLNYFYLKIFRMPVALHDFVGSGSIFILSTIFPMEKLSIVLAVSVADPN